MALSDTLGLGEHLWLLTAKYDMLYYSVLTLDDKLKDRFEVFVSFTEKYNCSENSG